MLNFIIYILLVFSIILLIFFALKSDSLQGKSFIPNNFLKKTIRKLCFILKQKKVKDNCTKILTELSFIVIKSSTLFFTICIVFLGIICIIPALNDGKIEIWLSTLLMFCIMRFILYLLNLDYNRKNSFKRKMLRKIISIDKWDEFENIHNQTINSINLAKVKEEAKHNIQKILLGYIIIILDCTIFVWHTFNIKEANSLVIILFFIILLIGRALTIKETSKYKVDVIRKFIAAINPEMKYNNNRFVHELYKYSGFKDKVSNKINTTDYIEYNLDHKTSVKMVDLNLQYEVKTTRYDYAEKIFEGIIAKISREQNINNEILIERNKFIKRNNRVKIDITEFEKCFDIYAKDESSVEIILPSIVKEQILNLYKKYGIMFEISIKGKDIFIRFFTGGIFESIAFGTYYSKKKLYREYIIFTSILEIINKINEVL